MVEPRYILLRGAPGVGKSTVATWLKNSLQNGVCIEVDSLRQMFNDNDWENKEQHFQAIETAGILAGHFTACGRSPVMFVDTFSFGTVRLLTSRFESKNVAIYSLVANDDVIAARMKSRPLHGFQDISRSLVLNANIKSLITANEIQIDSSCLTPQAVAARIIQEEQKSHGHGQSV